MTDIQQRALEHAGSKLFRIRELVEHEPRTPLADCILAIINESPPWVVQRVGNV